MGIFIIVVLITFFIAVIIGLIAHQYITIMKEKYNVSDKVDAWFYFWFIMLWPLSFPLCIIMYFADYIGEKLADKVGTEIELKRAYEKELEEQNKDNKHEI